MWRKVMPYCGEITRGCLGGLVVMESNHDEIPVSEANMPSNPWRGVCFEDEGQQDDISYHHNRAGQYHNKTDKHL